MAFIDKLNNLTRNIGDKTNEAIEITKLNAKANTETNAAHEDVQTIGEFYYAKYLESGEADPAILEVFQSARAHYDAAAEARNEIENIRSAPKAEERPAGGFCPSCGAPVNPDSRFCASCGQRIGD